MSINITFRNTTKKRNSTAAVAGAGTVFPCDFLSPCSIYNPTIKLHGVGNPTAYNYFTIATYGYSYFIDDWEYNDTFWIARGSIDFLGSFRADILATSCYALYSDNQGNNRIVDNRVSGTYDCFYWELANQYLFWTGGGGDYYVLRTLGENGGLGGYVLDRAGYEAFTASIGVELDFDTTLAVQMSDAIGCIVGCMHFPIHPAGHGMTEIFLGTHGTGVQAQELDYLEAGMVLLTWARVHNDWRDAAFMDYTLWLPFVGGVSISPSDIGELNALSIYYTVDWVGGGVMYKVYAGMALIGTYSGLVGNSVPVTGYMGNAMGAVGGIIDATTSAAGALGAAASGNAGGAVAGLMGAIGSAAGAALSYKQKTASIIGGTTGCAYAGYDAGNVALYAVSTKASDTPSLLRPVVGLPAMKIVRVSDCTGYLQTSAFSCGGSAPAYCKDQINSMMDNGVYIE